MSIDLDHEWQKLAEQRTNELLARNQEITALKREREELRRELETLKAQHVPPIDAGEVDVSKMSAAEKMEYGRKVMGERGRV